MSDAHVQLHAANRKRLILVVEDEAVNRELLGMILGTDYQTIFAATGAEALETIKAHRETLSLVLLDLNLPDMHGMDILRRIKAEPDYARLPVIVMTSDKDAEVESLTIGAIDFIPKPYPMPRVVLARVLRTIELSEDRDLIRVTERDQLTGLYNEEFFYRYADQFDMFRKDVVTDAIVIDINRFHMINERYGKAYGDEVLRRVAERLKADVANTGGIVCRHEADTFFIYCPHRTDYAALLDDAASGLVDEAHGMTRIHMRMGVYSQADRTIDIERRFDRARLAANTVRGSFGKAVAIYDNALHEAELFEAHLLEDFQSAIDQRQFLVYFQPKFDIRPVEPVLSSAEALVRWVHPELGMISPGVFIPLFEKNGLIPMLDSYVWRETAARIRDWKDRLGLSVPVSVNVSRVDMYDQDFVAKMCALISEYGLSPRDLLLEITESAYTEDSDQIVETVKVLRSAGFMIEMDDFGSGYSSLNMISALPIDALKLDMQFIRNAFNGRKDTRMLEVILEIADSLMVPSIAEGVETVEQMFALKSMGCDIVQGYYFSKPVPAAEFEPFLIARKERMAAGTERPEADSSAGAKPFRFTYEAVHDILTGLYNRSAFEQLLMDGDRNRIALLLAEVDARSIPDGVAHDRTLKRIAAVLRASFRPVDFICRVHQDRFAVIMTRVDSTLKRLVLDKVTRINANLANPEDGLPTAALNVGVAFADRESPRGSILEDADAALRDAARDPDVRCRIFGAD